MMHRTRRHRAARASRRHSQGLCILSPINIFGTCSVCSRASKISSPSKHALRNCKEPRILRRSLSATPPLLAREVAQAAWVVRGQSARSTR